MQRMLVPTLWETIAGGFIRTQVCVISLLGVQVSHPEEVNYLLSDFIYCLLRNKFLWALILEGLRKTTENVRKDSHRLVRDSTPGFFYVERTVAKHFRRDVCYYYY